MPDYVIETEAMPNKDEARGFRAEWRRFFGRMGRREENIAFMPAGKQGEIIEVVLGVGLLDWRAPLHEKVVSIRRHTVVANVG